MAQGLIDSALQGYNTVLFMYGQTSSGKTFTLFGGGGIDGIVGHSLEYVYKQVMESVDTEYLIKVTYSELYNEELKDLLSPTAVTGLTIMDDPMLGPIIKGITEENFTSVAEVRRLLQEGENRRHFGVTNMNAHSSRSHVMVRLGIESRKVVGKPANPFRTSWGRDKPSCVSTLNLVDLAGSERAGKSGTSGQSLKEGSFINKSLLTLGTVISNLSEGRSTQHIPYRNSKLTRLLASALGGNAKTCMITCISPASGNVSESLSTLRFAQRAKRIVNTVQKNEFQDAKSLANKLALQRAEMDALRDQLELSRQMGFDPEGGSSIASFQSQAVSATVKLKFFKFMMRHTPAILQALKVASKPDVAKAIQEDVKAVLAGSKDVEETMEDHFAALRQHLPREELLLRKISSLIDMKESGAMDTYEESEDGKSLIYSAKNGKPGKIGSSLDIFMSGFDSDGCSEQLERSFMVTEDTAVKHFNAMTAVSADLRDTTARERALKKKLEEEDEEHRKTKDRLKVSQAAEVAQIKEVEILRAELSKLRKSNLDSSESTAHHFQSLELQVLMLHSIRYSNPVSARANIDDAMHTYIHRYARRTIQLQVSNRN